MSALSPSPLDDPSASRPGSAAPRSAPSPGIVAQPVGNFLTAAPPTRRLDEATLRDFGHLLNSTGKQLRSRLGDEAALILLNQLAGAQIRVPMSADNNRHGAARWAHLSDLLGERAMHALSAYWGGFLLNVPVCARLHIAIRARWIREQFDTLTSSKGPGLSAYVAVCALCDALAPTERPMTFRQVEIIVNNGECAPVPAAQDLDDTAGGPLWPFRSSASTG